MNLQVVTTNGVSLEAVLIAELWAHLTAMNLCVALKEFRFELLKPDKSIAPGTPVFSYAWSAKDGRKWSQDLVFDSGSNPSMTFSISDSFRLGEVECHRPLRDFLVAQAIPRNLSLVAVTW